VILLTISAIISCKTEQTEKAYTDAEITAESNKANDFFQKSFDARVDRSPQFQTRLGIKTDYGKLDDNSSEAVKKEDQINKEELAWLRDSINVNALSKDALLSYKLYSQKLENDIDDYQYRLYNYPVNQMHGAQSDPIVTKRPNQYLDPPAPPSNVNDVGSSNSTSYQGILK